MNDSTSGKIQSFEPLDFETAKRQLRARRYRTARAWAARRSKRELEHTVAALFSKRLFSKDWERIQKANAYLHQISQRAEQIEVGAKYMGDAIRLTKREAMRMKDLLIRLSNEAPILARQQLARKGAIARLERDPRQVAKHEALLLWVERYEGKHPKLRTNEQFAMECMRRWPALTNIGTILTWCTAWNKVARPKAKS